jgi:DNA-binding winged helix-turn-helix (wHTH) protein
MILYIKDLGNSTKKLLDTISNFSKVGYKFNLQISVAFLYTNNEQIEKEYRKAIPFTIALKNQINNKGYE